MAADTATGQVAWSTGIGAWVSYPPAIGPRTVYAVDEAAGVTALDWSTGRRRWQVTVEGRVMAAPVVAREVVVVPTDRGVVGLDAADGTRAWRVAVSGMPSRPAQGGGRVVVGDGTSDIRAIDPATGEVHWRQEADGHHVAVSDWAQTVLTSGFSGPLVGLDLETGDQRWATQRQVGWAVPHPGPGTVAYVAVDAQLWRVDAATGEVRRLAGLSPDMPPSDRSRSGPDLTVGPQGLLYLWHPDGGLSARTPTDGTQIWSDEWPRGVSDLALGWADRRPWLAAVDDSRTRLAVVPAPHRPRPPVPTSLEPDQDCPATPLHQRPYATVAAGSHIEITGVSVAPPRRYTAMRVVDVDGVDKPITIRGERLDGPGTMGFRTNSSQEPQPQLELRPASRRLAEGWPPHWAITPALSGPGCWAYHIDGPDYHDDIVVEVTPEYFQALSGPNRTVPPDTS